MLPYLTYPSPPASLLPPCSFEYTVTGWKTLRVRPSAAETAATRALNGVGGADAVPVPEWVCPVCTFCNAAGTRWCLCGAGYEDVVPGAAEAMAAAAKKAAEEAAKKAAATAGPRDPQAKVMLRENGCTYGRPWVFAAAGTTGSVLAAQWQGMAMRCLEKYRLGTLGWVSDCLDPVLQKLVKQMDQFEKEWQEQKREYERRGMRCPKPRPRMTAMPHVRSFHTWGKQNSIAI